MKFVPTCNDEVKGMGTPSLGKFIEVNMPRRGKASPSIFALVTNCSLCSPSSFAF